MWFADCAVHMVATPAVTARVWSMQLIAKVDRGACTLLALGVVQVCGSCGIWQCL